MEHRSRLLLLILGFLATVGARAETIAIGEQLADFSLPAVNGFARNLTEQRGLPLMLVWSGDCDNCEYQLKKYDALARKYKRKGLVSWAIWTPDGQDDSDAPKVQMPVLKYSPKLPNAWQIQPQPAVMLVGRDGTLDYLFVGNLNKNLEFTNHALAYWLGKDDLVHQR